jgi:hypothetical protein
MNFYLQGFKTTDWGGHDNAVWWWKNHFDLSGASLFLTDVELSSTTLSAVTCPISSHTGQRFPLFHVQCRITFDGAFCRCRSNVESHWTALSCVPRPMSSHTRQRFPLFHVQCRVALDSAFRCTRPSFELISTVLYCVYDCFIGSCYLVAACELWRLQMFWKINLYQIVGLHKNNLDCVSIKNS